MVSLRLILLVHCVIRNRHPSFHSIGAAFLSALDFSWLLGAVIAFIHKVLIVLFYSFLVYRDMRHPSKFSHALGVSYAITFTVDLTMGVIGYLMFGKYVLQEVIHQIISLIADYSKHFRQLRVSPHPQLHHRINNRYHSDNENAVKYPSDQYNPRHLTRSLPNIHPFDNILLIYTLSTRILSCIYPHGNCRTPCSNCNCFPRL